MVAHADQEGQDLFQAEPITGATAGFSELHLLGNDPKHVTRLVQQQLRLWYPEFFAS
jgi:hypothetical protein